MVVTAQLLRKCFTKTKILATPFSFQAKHFSTSSSSPLLMLPSKESAAAAATTANIYILRNSCFYNVQKQTFVTNEDFNVCCSNALVDQRVRSSNIVGSSHGWLVFLDYDTQFFPLTMSHALSSQSVTLPLVEKPPQGISSYQLGKSVDGVYEISGSVQERKLVDYVADKVVMSPHGVVMALHGEHTMLSYHKLGDDKWIFLEKSSKYTDLLYEKDDHKFCTCGHSGNNFEVISWDFRDIFNPKKESYLIKGGSYLSSEYEYYLRKFTAKKCYLAQLSGDIHMIVRHFAWHVTQDDKILRCESDKSCKHPYKTVAWDVVKLDPVKNMIVPVKSLGDKALFLGINDPFALSASEYTGLKPNSIYFADDQALLEHHHSGPDPIDPRNYPYGGHDCGIFNMEDGSFSPCYQSKSKKIMPPPVWIAPH